MDCPERPRDTHARSTLAQSYLSYKDDQNKNNPRTTMILSQTAQYGLRAVLYLSEHDTEGPLRVEDIANALDVPRNYLSKILHVLARAGMLTSTRGPHGGFVLSRRADSLTLDEVVRHFDDFPTERRCVLGHEICSDTTPCAAHERWKEVATSVRAFFRETTVADLADIAEGPGIEVPPKVSGG